MTSPMRAAFTGCAAARPWLRPLHPLSSAASASSRYAAAAAAAAADRPGRVAAAAARRPRHPPVASASARRARRASAAALAEAAAAATGPPPPTGAGVPPAAAAVGDDPPAAGAEEEVDADALSEVATFVIDAEEAGQRLDKVLAARFPGQSRSYYQALVADGHVTVTEGGGAPASAAPRKAAKLRAGDAVRVVLAPTAAELPLVPEDIPLDVLYEDEHMVAVNKPAGLVVHPAPGNWTGTLVHALAYRYKGILEMVEQPPPPPGGDGTAGCGDGAAADASAVAADDDGSGEWATPHAASLAAKRPGLVHRLDKGTSGVMVAALTPAAHRALVAAFAARRVDKTYVAITAGSAAAVGCASAEFASPIGRHPTERTKMAVVATADGGRPAHTLVENVASDAAGLLHVARVTIATGRTHQIRVHAAAAKAPVLGDGLYGSAEVNRRFHAAAPRPMLHAAALGLDHPVTGERLELHAPLPADMAHLLRSRIYPTFEAEQPEWAVRV
ncbi:hypothetical protein BU14_2280s0001, partial [Porphyra umbilicalis]